MSRRPPKIPKDLGVKIGTPEEVLWTDIVNKIKIDLKNHEDQVIVDKVFLEVAEEKLKAEQKISGNLSQK